MMKTLILHLSVWVLSSLAPLTAASAKDVALHYKVYWAGFSVVEMVANIRLENNIYHVSNQYHSKGLLSIFSKFENQASATGVIDGKGIPQGEFYTISGTWSGKSYDHRVTFDPLSGGGKVLSRKIINGDKDWDRMDVAEERKVGPDPMTLLFRMMLNREHEILPLFGKDQLQRHQVYDGTVVVEYQHYCDQKTELKETKRSIFSGEAVQCDFGLKFIDGKLKKKPKKKKDKKPDNTMKIWVSEWPDLPYLIPVRSEFPATFGKVRMCLTKVEQ